MIIVMLHFGIAASDLCDIACVDVITCHYLCFAFIFFLYTICVNKVVYIMVLTFLSRLIP